MTWEITLIFGILVVAVALFVSERLPVDLIALLVLATLMLTGLVTTAQGLSGFSNPATITVAAMFVLSAGLQRTGALVAVKELLVRLGDSPGRLTLVVMLVSGVVSAFINNTAAVAFFIPVVIAAAAAQKTSASRLLIPLSYASQFGGVCTLVGTSTNLVVHGIAEREGAASFTLFEFGRLGWILFVVGTLYLLLVGKWLLPARRGTELTTDYQLREYVTELRVLPGSPMIGKTVVEALEKAKRDVRVLAIIRGTHSLYALRRERMAESDLLLVQGSVDDLMELRERQKLALEPEFKLGAQTFERGEQKLVEVLVAPGSALIGLTLAALSFRWRFNAIVLAIQRHGQVLRQKLGRVRLRLGDALLLLTPGEEVARLHASRHIIVLGESERAGPQRNRAPWALAIVAAVVLLAAFNVLPILVSAVAGCAVMLLTRCLTVEQAYEGIDWQVILLLAGLLPLGLAMEESGAARYLAEAAIALAGGTGPTGVLAGLYLITVVLTSCISNTATAALLAPIAITVAEELGVDPKPMLIAVAFAASTCFSTPVGYQTNTMVYNAGGYRFADFIRVGVPLDLLFWGLSVWFIPRLWPF